MKYKEVCMGAKVFSLGGSRDLIVEQLQIHILGYQETQKGYLGFFRVQLSVCISQPLLPQQRTAPPGCLSIYPGPECSDGSPS